MQTYTTLVVEQSFQVEFVNPCHDTVLAPFVIEDMERFVDQPEMK